MKITLKGGIADGRTTELPNDAPVNQINVPVWPTEDTEYVAVYHGATGEWMHDTEPVRRMTTSEWMADLMQYMDDLQARTGTERP